MKTELDSYSYQKLYIEGVSYKGNVLVMDIAHVQEENNQSVPPRFIVVFNDVAYFQAYDEVNHLPEHDEGRDTGVIAVHHRSTLLVFLQESTKVLDAPGEFLHYSVMTGDEFFHVVTRTAPQVLNAT